MASPTVFEVRQTATFRAWLKSLRDVTTRAAVVQRIARLEQGHVGDVAAVGEGVSELRIHRGPGYRLYFVRQEAQIILLLCGGDKSSQVRDIERAKAMFKEL